VISGPVVYRRQNHDSAGDKFSEFSMLAWPVTRVEPNLSVVRTALRWLTDFLKESHAPVISGTLPWSELRKGYVVTRTHRPIERLEFKMNIRYQPGPPILMLNAPPRQYPLAMLLPTGKVFVSGGEQMPAR
jgi:hypothetical protein